MQQRSDAWYNIKAGRVTGTSFAELVSKESTIGYKRLVNRLASEIIIGKADERDKSYTNELMEESLDMEADAKNKYEEITEAYIDDVGFITPDKGEFTEWIGVSPDGLIDEHENKYRGGLETKCSLAKTHIGYIEAGVLPNEYKHQVQGALFVTGLEYWDFMSYYPGMKPFVIRVVKDEKMHEEYTERLRLLIKHVKAKIEKYNKYDYES
jgi:hypothetical protein